MAEFAQFLAGALIMIGVLGLAARFLPNLGDISFGERRPSETKRLKVIETEDLDSNRRLTLVRWDDREHLILSGGDEDVVVETREAR